MLEFDKDYVPLQLEMNERITSYIIDNTFLGSHRLGAHAHYPYRAFSLLYDLFRNDATREVIPEQLQTVLDVDFNLPKFFSQDLLIGEEDHGYHYGIKLDMNITEDSAKPAHLCNIHYYHGSAPINLAREITLTPTQAFYLFANILANNRCSTFEKLFQPKDFLASSPDRIISSILKHERYRSDKYGKAYTILNQFAVEYFYHLSSELTANHLTPTPLLYFSGATTLAYLRHLPIVDKYLADIINILRKVPLEPFNYSVLCYTLLYSASTYSKTSDKITRFLGDYSLNRKNFYDRDIAKEFPLSNPSFDLEIF